MSIVHCAVQDEVLRCLPAHSRQDTLLKVQDRVTKLLFVELLFEKGPRESEMIQAEYSWRNALLDRAEGRDEQQHMPGKNLHNVEAGIMLAPCAQRASACDKALPWQHALTLVMSPGHRSLLCVKIQLPLRYRGVAACNCRLRLPQLPFQ